MQKLKIELQVKNVREGNRCRLQSNREGSAASFWRSCRVGRNQRQLGGERQVEQGIACLGGQALGEGEGERGRRKRRERVVAREPKMDDKL